MIDTVTRLLRRLPDGRVGAEYMGLVYPLSDTNGISLDAQWCYPSDAPICLEPPEVASSRSASWHLENLASRSYLFLNGSADYLERALAALHAASITVEHWGPSFREGHSGRLFDWFIRMPVGKEDAPSSWELDQILAPLEDEANKNQSDATLQDQLNRAQRLLDALLRRQAHAERQLSEAFTRADAQAAAILEIGRRAKERERILETELAFLRASMNASKSATKRPTPEEAQLREIIRKLETEREDALGKWTVSDEAFQRAEAERRELQARLEELALTPPPSPAGGRRGRQRSLDELETTIRVLLPDIRLLRGSCEFIVTEVDDRRDLYTKLRMLSENPTSLRGKRVHTADGWLEIHFSTGRARDGRIYYKRKTENGAAMWDILVSDKAAQAGDISWLGGL
ncbi:hypothetical protein [Sphingosinicella humi]|uniref:Uncharacterized protein n=1 Tax=Allosphingosinicella humi TaxID=2068657 RepID=A0A2U2J595_9SPHN|nr:hypothetical protein [Sphingosinicella humi]PWG03513.1 hypothetical protein DF286_12000 [Sphingosinicella humi]